VRGLTLLAHRLPGRFSGLPPGFRLPGARCRAEASG